VKDLINIAREKSNINANILHSIHLYLHHSYLHRPGRPITPAMFKEFLKEDSGLYLEYLKVLKVEGIIEFKISDDKINIWIYPSSFILNFLRVP